MPKGLATRFYTAAAAYVSCEPWKLLRSCNLLGMQIASGIAPGEGELDPETLLKVVQIMPPGFHTTPAGQDEAGATKRSSVKRPPGLSAYGSVEDAITLVSYADARRPTWAAVRFVSTPHLVPAGDLELLKSGVFPLASPDYYPVLTDALAPGAFEDMCVPPPAVVAWLTLAMELVVRIVNATNARENGEAVEGGAASGPALERRASTGDEEAALTLTSPKARAAYTGMTFITTAGEPRAYFKDIDQVVDLPHVQGAATGGVTPSGGAPASSDPEPAQVWLRYPAPLPHVTFQCTNCAGLLRSQQSMSCANCKCVHYCSRKCQVKHWKAGHKKECPRLREFMAQQAADAEIPDCQIKFPGAADLSTAVLAGMASTCTWLADHGVHKQGVFLPLCGHGLLCDTGLWPVNGPSAGAQHRGGPHDAAARKAASAATPPVPPVEWALAEALCPPQPRAWPCVTAATPALASWQAWFEAFRLPTSTSAESPSPLPEALSWVATIYHGLQQLAVAGRVSLTPGAWVTLHIVHPPPECCTAAWLLQCLLPALPGVSLRVLFVGPDVAASLNRKTVCDMPPQAGGSSTTAAPHVPAAGAGAGGGAPAPPAVPTATTSGAGHRGGLTVKFLCGTYPEAMTQARRALRSSSEQSAWDTEWAAADAAVALNAAMQLNESLVNRAVDSIPVRTVWPAAVAHAAAATIPLVVTEPSIADLGATRALVCEWATGAGASTNIDDVELSLNPFRGLAPALAPVAHPRLVSGSTQRNGILNTRSSELARSRNRYMALFTWGAPVKPAGATKKKRRKKRNKKGKGEADGDVDAAA